MDPLQQFLNRLRTTWTGMGATYRFLALALAMVVAVTTLALSYLSFAAEYIPLATGLAPEDAAAITAQLDSASIPYRMDVTGGSIQVAKEHLARARVELASHGVVARGGKGFELFDDVSLGMTPFVQNVTYIRALQGELSRSIMQLEPVASARVIIARAEPSPFIREQQPATAGVVLKLKSGATVSRSMASGIVSLVAGCIEGLKPENVTVVDTTGRLLSESRSDDPDSLSASDLDRRRELESYLSTRAEEMLSRQLGAGRALVRVSADLNYQKMKETRETYVNDEKAVKSEQIVSSESGSGGGGESRGVAGAGSNLGRGQFVSTGGGGGGKNKNEKSINEYLVPKTVQELENRLGGVLRLTIAAMVDLSPREGAEAGSQSPIAIKDVEELIKETVGFKVGRDEIKVTNVPLAAAPPPAEAPIDRSWIDKAETYVHLVRNVSVMVAFVFLAGTVFLLTRRLQAASAAAAAAADERARSAAGLPSADGTYASDQQRFVELAGRDPQQVARMLAVLLRNGAA
jgi:flagellar M-ring protein FliF